MTMRMPRRKPWRLEDWTTDSKALEILATAVRERKNILISGSTGSGKTSLLSGLLSACSSEERILCLEDSDELRSSHPHVVRLLTKKANSDGLGALDLRVLLRESLRMRPDRLVLGECRGAEALDLLLALSSGHLGSMATIHASCARAALGRLETLASISMDNISLHSVRELVQSAIHLVVQLEKKDRNRVVASISELRGIDGGRYIFREIF